MPLDKPPRDDKSYIEATFGLLCNIPLLRDHSASWEILVSKRSIMEYTSDSDGEKTAQVPVIIMQHYYSPTRSHFIACVCFP